MLPRTPPLFIICTFRKGGVRGTIWFPEREAFGMENIDIYFLYIGMLLWIVQNIIISIIIIFLTHNLVIYFKESYTTKKTKDVVGFHIQKYKTIMDELQETNEKEKQELILKASEAAKMVPEVETKEKTDLSEKDLRSMNEDLADFIQRQMQG
jgi:hypothetical protein